jgi:hypothetical protein
MEASKNPTKADAIRAQPLNLRASDGGVQYRRDGHAEKLVRVRLTLTTVARLQTALPCPHLRSRNWPRGGSARRGHVNPPASGKGVGRRNALSFRARPRSLPPSGQEQPPVDYWLAATAAASNVNHSRCMDGYGRHAGAEHMATDRSDCTEKVWLVGWRVRGAVPFPSMRGMERNGADQPRRTCRYSRAPTPAPAHDITGRRGWAKANKEKTGRTSQARHWTFPSPRHRIGRGVGPHRQVRSWTRRFPRNPPPTPGRPPDADPTAMSPRRGYISARRPRPTTSNHRSLFIHLSARPFQAIQ